MKLARFQRLESMVGENQSNASTLANRSKACVPEVDPRTRGECEENRHEQHTQETGEVKEPPIPKTKKQTTLPHPTLSHTHNLYTSTSTTSKSTLDMSPTTLPLRPRVTRSPNHSPKDADTIVVPSETALTALLEQDGDLQNRTSDTPSAAQIVENSRPMVDALNAQLETRDEHNNDDDPEPHDTRKLVPTSTTTQLTTPKQSSPELTTTPTPPPPTAHTPPHTPVPSTIPSLTLTTPPTPPSPHTSAPTLTKTTTIPHNLAPTCHRLSTPCPECASVISKWRLDMGMSSDGFCSEEERPAWCTKARDTKARGTKARGAGKKGVWKRVGRVVERGVEGVKVGWWVLGRLVGGCGFGFGCKWGGRMEECGGER